MPAPPLAPRPRHPRPLSLGALRANLGGSVRFDGAAADAEAAAPDGLTGVTLDSRTVEPGDLYLALPGATTHGARFAPAAAERGAAAVLTDPAGAEDVRATGLPLLLADEPRALSGPVSAAIHGHPGDRLTVLGVTGTNGKTSTAYLVAAALRRLGVPAGMIGTNGTEFTGADGHPARVGTVRTTPEATELHGLLALMAESGVTHVIMEVSSHAVVMHRVDGLVFDVMGFTNLSQDHLDFHPTMEDYFAAKAEMFTPERTRRAAISTDTVWGARLAANCTVPHAAVAPEHAVPGLEAAAADVAGERFRIAAPETAGFGHRFTLRGTERDIPLTSGIPGSHYLLNTALAYLLLEAVGISGDEAARALADGAAIPGRMERVDPAGTGIVGVVDFAHTEDALVKALTSLRPVAGAGRILAVLGAGGDRDRGKRDRMGHVAAALSDVVIVTDDNPRSENPQAIRASVLTGAREANTARVQEVASRSDAISWAVEEARSGDVVLVAGKGAETGQDFGGDVVPFDDREELSDALRRRTPTALEEDHNS